MVEFIQCSTLISGNEIKSEKEGERGMRERERVGGRRREGKVE